MRQHSFSSRTSLSRMALWGHLFGNEVSGTMPTACAACSSSPASSILMNVRVVSSDPRSHRGLLVGGSPPPPSVHLPVRFNFPLPQTQRLQAPDVSVSSGKHHCVPETALTHKTTDECPLTWTLTPCVLILKKSHFLVDGFNSSEDISQLGWLFPIYAKKSSKPPTRSK